MGQGAGAGASMGRAGRRAGRRGEVRAERARGAGGRTEPPYSKEDGEQGARERTPEVVGASPLPRSGLGEMAEPPAGPAAAPEPVIQGALTRFTPRRRRPAQGKVPAVAFSSAEPWGCARSWASRRPSSTVKTTLVPPTSTERLRVKGLGRPLSTRV